MPADLFLARNTSSHRPVGYCHFDIAAEAIRYVVEQMPAEFFKGTVLGNSDDGLAGENIRLRYSSNDCPLARKRLNGP